MVSIELRKLYVIPQWEDSKQNFVSPRFTLLSREGDVRIKGKAECKPPHSDWLKNINMNEESLLLGTWRSQGFSWTADAFLSTILYLPSVFHSGSKGRQTRSAGRTPSQPLWKHSNAACLPSFLFCCCESVFSNIEWVCVSFLALLFQLFLDFSTITTIESIIHSLIKIRWQ